jgi:hypothetical protein
MYKKPILYVITTFLSIEEFFLILKFQKIYTINQMILKKFIKILTLNLIYINLLYFQITQIRLLKVSSKYEVC